MKKITILLGFLISLTITAQNDLEQGLLLHYKFDGDVLDSSVNGFDGTASEVTYTIDRYGNDNGSASFNGVDSFIDLPNVSKLKPDLPLTIAFWINYNSTNTQDRAVFNTSFEEEHSSGVYLTHQSTTGRYAIGYGDGTPNYSSFTRRTYVSNTDIAVNEWKHIAIVIKSNQDMKVYINTVESGGSYSGSGGDLSYSENAGTIGRHDQDFNLSAYYFKGSLDDFMYWNRALSTEEVNDVFNLSTLSNTDNPKEYDKNEIYIYPNPVRNNITIKTPYEILRMHLYDTNGKRHKINFKKNGKGFYSDDLPKSKGVYLLKIVTSSKVFTKKIIMQ